MITSGARTQETSCVQRFNLWTGNICIVVYSRREKEHTPLLSRYLRIFHRCRNTVRILNKASWNICWSSSTGSTPSLSSSLIDSFILTQEMLFYQSSWYTDITCANKQTRSDRWRHPGDKLTVRRWVWLRGGRLLSYFRTHTHTCYVTPPQPEKKKQKKTLLPSDVTFLTLLIGVTATAIADFDVWLERSNCSYSNPMLWLHCCSDPRGCSTFSFLFFFFFFPISQTGTFYRCEFFCPTVVVISTRSLSWQCPGLEFVFCEISKCHFWSPPPPSPPPPHPLLLLGLPPSPYMPVTLSHPLQLSKLPLFTFFSRLPSISHRHFSFSRFLLLLLLLFRHSLLPSLSLWC